MPFSTHSLLICVFAFMSVVTAQDTVIPLVCHTGVQIIALPGSNIKNGSDSYGLTASFVKILLAEIPDSSSISINYNRFHNASTLTGPQFDAECEEGAGAFEAALLNYTTACPNTPIVLHGYSEGAVIVGNVLCGASSPGFPVTSPLASSFASHIIAAIFYGDETRTANQPYNYGTCAVNAPWLSRRSPSCSAFAPVMQNYCNDDDFNCCSSVTASTPWPTSVNPHWLYPKDYDVNATQFVVNQYNKYWNITTSRTSTAMTATTTSMTSTFVSVLAKASASSSSSAAKSTTLSTSIKITTVSSTSSTHSSSATKSTTSSSSSAQKSTTSSSSSTQKSTTSSSSSAQKSTTSSSTTKGTTSSTSTSNSTTTTKITSTVQETTSISISSSPSSSTTSAHTSSTLTTVTKSSTALTTNTKSSSVPSTSTKSSSK